MTTLKKSQSIQCILTNLSKVLHFMKSHQAQMSILHPKARRARKYLEKHLGLVQEPILTKKKALKSAKKRPSPKRDTPHSGTNTDSVA